MSLEAPDICLNLWPSRIQSPIYISVPHAGVNLPQGLGERLSKEALLMADTDHGVTNLLSFAPEIGIPVQSALFSRLVVDLNRPLDHEEPLYPGSNRISGVIPLATFDKEAVYLPGCEPDASEMEARIRTYYLPYYQNIESHLQKARQHFGKTLLLDMHSIRPVVKAIQPQEFAHFNFSNRGGITCPTQWLEQLAELVHKAGYTSSINDPFLGGNLTRRFGRPETGVYSLQIEMNQTVYLTRDNKVCPEKWLGMRVLLESMFHALHEAVR